MQVVVLNVCRNRKLNQTNSLGQKRRVWESGIEKVAEVRCGVLN